MYIGVNTNQSREAHFETFSLYNTTVNTFETCEFDAIVDGKKKEIEKFITTFLKKHNKEQGVNIQIFSEWGRWCSLSFSSTFAAILATTLYVLIGKITKKDLENYEAFMTSDVFQEVENTARQIALFTRYGNSSWSMHVLYKGYAPALFYCETFDTNIQIADIQHLKRSFTPFTDLFKIQDHNYLPFDYAIVFSWLPNNSQKIEQAIQLDEKKFHKYRDFVKNKILPITQLKEDIHFIQTLKNWVYNQFVDMFALSTIMILESLEKIYTDNEDSRNAEHLIDTVNRVRYLFYMLEREPSDFIEKFTSYFLEASYNKEKIGMVNSYSSKLWGSCIVILKDWTNKQHFSEAVKRLKTDYPTMHVHYASRIDGVTEDGICIEQHISDKVFSQYIQKDQVFYKNNQGEAFLGNYNDLLHRHTDGLLLDVIDNKIYLNGRKLTSSDIPSQTTTINVLDKLLDHIGKDISNRDFEISSYSKNKNEMIGKIVLPLISLIERETGEKFPLICKGSIYDFYMKLNPSTVPLAIIKRI